MLQQSDKNLFKELDKKIKKNNFTALSGPHGLTVPVSPTDDQMQLSFGGGDSTEQQAKKKRNRSRDGSKVLSTVGGST